MRVILALGLVSLLLSLAQPVAMAETVQADESFFFVTYYRRGINEIFFSSLATNNSTDWGSSVRPWGIVSVHLVGEGLNYSLQDMDGNLSLNNTTTAAHTVVGIESDVNASTLWLVLTINGFNESGNATEEIHNFGRMVFGREVVSLVEEVIKDTVLRSEAERDLYRAVVSTVVLVGLWLLLVYLVVVAVKRGRVLIH